MKVRFFHNQIHFDPKMFKKVCNVEFDEREWDTFIGLCHDKNEIITDAELFWKNNEGSLPSLYKAATFLMYLPIVVTLYTVRHGFFSLWIVVSFESRKLERYYTFSFDCTQV